MKKVKILLSLIENNNKPGGTETLILNLAKEFKSMENFEIRINFYTILPERLHFFNRFYPSYFLFFLRSIFLSIFFRPNVSFSSTYFLNFVISLLKKIYVLRNTKVVFRESTFIFSIDSSNRLFKLLNLEKKKLLQKLYKCFYNEADIIIFQTPGMYEEYVANLPRAQNSNLVIIPNPIDRQFVIKKSFLEIPEKNLGLYIVVAGRFVKEKAYDILIPAFKKINEVYKDYKLVILGEGPLEYTIKDLVNKSDLTNSVIFLGFKDNPFPYFRLAKCCVLPSRSEGFPNVLLQMMCVNDTVVSTKCTDTIDEIEGIILSEINDINDLSAKVINALSLNQTEKRNNRILFDKELEKRSLSGYIETVLNKLNL